MSQAETATRRKTGRTSRKEKARVCGIEHRRAAVELRKKGYSYPAIAREMGLALSTVHEHVSKAMAESLTVTREEAEHVRQMELERLDGLLLALDAGIASGDVRAIEAAVKIGTARAKLLGIVQPKSDTHLLLAARVDPARLAALSDQDLERVRAGDPEAIRMLCAAPEQGATSSL